MLLQTLNILLERVIVARRLESLLMLSILRAEKLLLHLLNGLNRTEIAACRSTGSIYES